MSFARRAALYFHTLRYLKPVQVWGRVAYRLRRPAPDLSSPPSVRSISGSWQRPAVRRQSMFGPAMFRFLNKEGEICSPGDWNSTTFSRLWLYNLHYFDDLNAENAPERNQWHKKLIARWIAENPPGNGAGWEPYPLSLRIVNWVKWTLEGNGLDNAARHSLAVQARYLCRRLEYHLLGNHLFANAKALVFAGCYFEGVEAEEWLHRGMAILEREVTEQILPDGGQFERSTMYHALAFEDMLDLVNLSNAYPSAFVASWQVSVAAWKEVSVRMGRWLMAMCHPDGEIGFFNDAAIGIAPPPAELNRYMAQLGFSSLRPPRKGVTHLAESGYVRVSSGEMAALLDVAPVGPDYLPGHAHADTLSFEFSMFGKRVLVNSGTSCYGSSAERLRQRGTASHNTVMVDGLNSSEIWAGFRVARRARPVGLEILEDEVIKVSCAHDGYSHLAGRPEHARLWLFTGDSLVIEDRVSGHFEHAEAYFHFHPEIKVDVLDGGLAGRLGLGNGCWVTWQVGAGKPFIEASSYHPRFGVRETARCLVLHLLNGFSRIRFARA